MNDELLSSHFVLIEFGSCLKDSIRIVAFLIFLLQYKVTIFRT